MNKKVDLLVHGSSVDIEAWGDKVELLIREVELEHLMNFVLEKIPVNDILDQYDIETLLEYLKEQRNEE